MIPPPPCNLCVSFLLAALSRLCIFLPAFLTCSSLYEKKRGINIVLRKMFYIEVANYLMATRCFFSPLFSPLSVIIILQNKKEISHYLPSRLVPSTFFFLKIIYGLILHGKSAFCITDNFRLIHVPIYHPELLSFWGGTVAPFKMFGPLHQIWRIY